jgi:hypothetical protein
MSMNCDHEKCPYGIVYELQAKNLSEDLHELKERVKSLETTLAWGVMLLVANLVAVSVSLFQQLYRL